VNCKALFTPKVKRKGCLPSGKHPYFYSFVLKKETGILQKAIPLFLFVYAEKSRPLT
jgi:hypothetical protein